MSVKNSRIEISTCDYTFESIYNSIALPEHILSNVKKADMLLLPNSEFRGVKNTYPELTYKFFDFFKNELKKMDMVIDLVVSDEDYKELELHSRKMRLPTLMIGAVILPIAINMVSSYLYDNLTIEETDISIKIVVEKENVSKMLEYEGSAEDFEKTLKAATETLFKE